MNRRRWVHRDPSHWSRVLGHVTIASAAEVDAAARRASDAATAWESRPVAERTAFLGAWSDRLADRADELAERMATEIGKPVADGRQEVARAVGLLRSTTASLQGADEWEACGDGVAARRRPLGVVGVITPWNNPVAIPVGKLGPALALGNAVVWKPALPAPGTTAAVAEAVAASGLPDGLLNVVAGDAATARAVIAHPAVAAVSVTGSSATGVRAATSCARLLKPLQAELGGNNAAVVLAGADLDRAAADLATSAYSFAGQRCTAARRLIVERSVEDDFLDRFEAAVNAMEVGDPHHPATRVGPVISRRHQRRLSSQLAGARARGGEVVFGGHVPAELSRGCFLRPALTRPAHVGDEVVGEETFGPLAVLLTADDFDHALRLCNDVRQGLVAALYSDDPAHQRRFLAGARAGSVKLNRPTVEVSPVAPFGGWKESGVGPPEHGRWDLDFYTRPQAVYGINA